MTPLERVTWDLLATKFKEHVLSASFVHVAYGFQVYDFMGLLSVPTSRSPRLYLLLVPFLGVFSFCLFVLLYSDLLLFYLIIFYYHPLDACLFSNERQKRNGLDGRGDGEN